jgi:uncharacterized protein YndB with AHSA1/START domain
MTEAVGTEPIVHEKWIDATPETVFGFFTEPEKLTRWLCVEATVDPRPGGINHQTHADAEDNPYGPYYMRGEFVEVSAALPESGRDSHEGGWAGMLERLAAAAGPG